LKIIRLITICFFVLLISGSIQTAVCVESYQKDVSNYQIPKQCRFENASSLSIENISGALGISAVIKNTGGIDFFNISVTVNISSKAFVRLRITHILLPRLLVNDSFEVHVPVFGLGLGKFYPLPEITMVISASDEIQKEVTILAKVLGPFARIIGVIFKDAYNGFTLFSPEYTTKTLLMNQYGTVVHTWQSDFIQGLGVHLLENGNLIRTTLPFLNPVFVAGGVTGGVQVFDWNGSLLWMFNYSDNQHCLHHDIKVLPNGHILMIAWEYKTADEAMAMGRKPDTLPEGALWPDTIIEVKMNGSSEGTIVWEWHLWDHLIQDFDPTKKNYGNVSQHPELLDINYGVGEGKQQVDWNHINSIDYNQKFDQILLSSHNQHEIWVIDHSTTSKEATGHTGGKSGKGGDFLYRYGNPQTYHAGNISDQLFFGQHDAQWIPQGLPGEGNILIFNNGEGRPDGQYSSIEEFTPPVDSNGTYILEPGSAYGPREMAWRYIAPNPSDFFAAYLSGTQRLPNGNTYICDGDHGKFFEVTADGSIVWKYLNTIPNPIQNQVFTIHCYAPEYPGLKFLPSL